MAGARQWPYADRLVYFTAREAPSQPHCLSPAGAQGRRGTAPRPIRNRSTPITVRVRKAVLPAAGFGTRFLPATKAIAKEVLPLVDRPIIQSAVEEAVASWIEQIIIV